MSNNHVMLDLETLDIKATGIIMSIGAVAFDPMTNETGNTFYTVINVDDCIKNGLTCSKTTLDWWMKQTPEARTVLTESKKTDITLKSALKAFSTFWGENNLNYLWSNGSGFDAPMLSFAYSRTEINQPWHFTKEMCHRTMRSLSSVKEPERQGIYHNALDDALHQTRHLQAIFKEW